MKVLVSGSTGFVGTRVVEALARAGHEPVRLVRPTTVRPRNDKTPVVPWDPDLKTLSRGDVAALELDAVVNLSGEGIADGRWTSDRKARIRDSRVASTRLLSEVIAALPRRPKVLVSASAIGWYGERKDELLDESSSPGTGFLAEVCRDWEAATDPAEAAGIRVVKLRSGLVMGRSGGVLERMVTPFRLGVGGVIGTGRQWMSWISQDDLVGAILYALGAESLRGPVNAVAPEPLTNRDFTKALGRALSRPTFVGVPEAAVRLVFGEMAGETLLASQRVLPARLGEARFVFRHPAIGPFLATLLG